MIKKFTVLSVFMVVPFALMIAFSMNTAPDREGYLAFLENPFSLTRFEPGFVMIGKALSFITGPEASIIFICVIIYLLLAYSWSRIYRWNFIKSFLSFHLSLYLFFNYFAGTAIRNGLASGIAIALFAYAVTNRSRVAKVILLIAPSFHLGAALFSVLGWFYLQIHRYHFGFVIATISSAMVIFVFIFILPTFVTSSYYSQYLQLGSIGTERFRSFSMLVFALFSFLIWVHPRRDVWSEAVLIAAPILIFYLITGAGIFHRLLMPFFFIAAAVFFQRYEIVLGRFAGSAAYLFVLICGNFLGLAYAFRQWGLA